MDNIVFVWNPKMEKKYVPYLLINIIFKFYFFLFFIACLSGIKSNS